MGRREKLFEKLNSVESRYGFTFSELKSLLVQAGWKLTRSKGSHPICTSPTGQVVNLKKKRDKMKPAYVDDVKKALNPQ